MKRSTLILAFIALLTASHAAGIFWGRDAKLYVLIGMLGLYAILTLALFIMRRRFHREHPELAEALDADTSSPWYWRLLDVVIGVSFTAGPPLIVSLARHQPLSWESEFTGYHVLAMAAGVSVYLLGRAFVIKLWRRRDGVTNDAA